MSYVFLCTLYLGHKTRTTLVVTRRTLELAFVASLLVLRAFSAFRPRADWNELVPPPPVSSIFFALTPIAVIGVEPTVKYFFV